MACQFSVERPRPTTTAIAITSLKTTRGGGAPHTPPPSHSGLQPRPSQGHCLAATECLAAVTLHDLERNPSSRRIRHALDEQRLFVACRSRKLKVWRRVGRQTSRPPTLVGRRFRPIRRLSETAAPLVSAGHLPAQPSAAVCSWTCSWSRPSALTCCNVLVIVRLARRELVWINVTAHPSAEWIAQQITE